MPDLEFSDEKFSQQTENELKKIMLSAEHGAVFGNPHSGEVSPEMEGQFLDYIAEWEKQYALHKTITVYDLAGQPEWKSVAELNDMEVVAELERVHGILLANSVVLETLCEVEERELYRFITEELFNVEVEDIRIPGMRHHFIYEEFHPNHPYDIKNRITEVIEHLTGEISGELVPWGLDDNVNYGGQEFTKEEFGARMLLFRKSFKSLKVCQFVFLRIELNDSQTKANATCFLEFVGLRGGETVQHSGECKFSLMLNCEWWEINEVEFGIEL